MKSNYMLFVEQNINGHNVVLLKELLTSITKEELKEIIIKFDNTVKCGFKNPDDIFLNFESKLTDKLTYTFPKFGPISISYVEIKE